MRLQKFSRPGVLLMATVVAIITSVVVANATQTITAPNAAFFSYNLVPGAKSAHSVVAVPRYLRNLARDDIDIERPITADFRFLLSS